MKIIISPSKKIQLNKTIEKEFSPLFKEKANFILEELKKLSFIELKNIWECSESVAIKNYEYLLNKQKNSGSAIFAYKGLQFKSINVAELNDSELNFLQNHLYILSAVYGILKPFDTINFYRLDFNSKIIINKKKISMYNYWLSDLYNTIFCNDELVLNLSSLEYTKSFSKYLKKEDNIVNVVFFIMKDGKYLQQASISKKARGLMVNFIAKNSIQDLKNVKRFNEMGFVYSTSMSNKQKLVFIKERP